MTGPANERRCSPTAHLKGPHVDFAALSPLIALLGGAVAGAARRAARLALGARAARARAQPRRARRGAGLTIWQWNAEKSIVAGALRIDDLALALNLILIAGGACTVLLAWRSLAAREAAHGELHALLLTSIGGHVAAGGGAEHGRAVPRAGAAVDPAVRAVRDRNAPRALAGVGAEVPDRRLGRLGHAAVRARADLRRDRHDRLQPAIARRSPAAASRPTR